MKTIAKRWIATLTCLVAMVAVTHADTDKPISVAQLPATAQQTIKAHFAAKKVALAKMESGLIDKSYDVIFTTGEKIEFDRKGNWTEIDCKQSAVPAKLVPAKISQYVSTNYAGCIILQLERDSREYEVKLSNGVELTFNKQFQLIDID